MGDSLLVGRLISQDGRTSGIVVTFDYSNAGRPVASEIISEARKLVDQVAGDNPTLAIWYGGRVATSAAFSDSARSDMLVLAPIGYAIMLAYLAPALGSFRAAAALFIVGITASLSALGMAGWLGLEINPATSAAPTIIIAIAIASFMHTVTRAASLSSGQICDSASVQRALKSNLAPTASALGTTAVGFVTLNSAKAPPIQDLGTLVAGGLIVCFFIGYSWLPILLRGCRFRQSALRRWTGQLVERATAISIASDRRLVMIISIALLGVASCATLNEVDDQFSRYLDHRYEYRVHNDAIEKHLTGLEVIEFELNSGQPDGIFDSVYLDTLSVLESWLNAQEKVVFVGSIREVFLRLDRHLRNVGTADDTLPDDPELLAQYFLLYELSIPYGNSVSDRVSLDRASSRVTAILRSAKSTDIVSLKESAEERVAKVSKGLHTLTGTGLSTMYGYVTALNVHAMLTGTLMAVVLIAAMLVVTFKSVRLGFLTLLPNLSPALCAFGLWGIFVGEIGVAVCVVGVITLGIVVDDTVHMAWRYLQGIRDGLSEPEAVRRMFTITGEPMVLTTLALIIGFGTLGFSGFLVSSSMGTLSAITIALALIIDWFVFSQLLRRVVGAQGRLVTATPLNQLPLPHQEPERHSD